MTPPITRLDRAVGVLGGGAFGTTLAQLAGRAGHTALLWLRDEELAGRIAAERVNERYLPGFPLSESIETTADLAEVAERCQLLLVAIPSKSFRSVARRLGDHVRGDHVLVSATKGLEGGTYARMTEVLRQETCCLKIGALSGPNLAVEIMKNVPGATVVASRFDEVVRLAVSALRDPWFRVYASRDVLGVELGGAVKNVIAIAGGLCRGLGYGDNTLALLISRGLDEMLRLGERMGADRRTFAGLAGAGDLVVTAFSELSRNHRVGRMLAEGTPLQEALGELGQVAEGVPNARVVMDWAEEHGVDLPICRGVHAILYHGADPRDVLQQLMTLPARWEADNRPLFGPGSAGS
jgi:glycerol-3-phosphate dehydrogenase (NAD(P)+)